MSLSPLFSFCPKAGGIGAWYPVSLRTGEESEWVLPLAGRWEGSAFVFYQMTESVSLDEAGSHPPFVSSSGNTHHPGKFNCKINCARPIGGHFYLTTVADVSQLTGR